MVSSHPWRAQLNGGEEGLLRELLVWEDNGDPAPGWAVGVREESTQSLQSGAVSGRHTCKSHDI